MFDFGTLLVYKGGHGRDKSGRNGKAGGDG